jgi:hypothetical protein
VAADISHNLFHRKTDSIQGEGSVITRYRASLKAQKGAAGYILLWLLGVPIPVLLLIYALRGCT